MAPTQLKSRLESVVDSFGIGNSAIANAGLHSLVRELRAAKGNGGSHAAIMHYLDAALAYSESGNFDASEKRVQDALDVLNNNPDVPMGHPPAVDGK